MTGRSKWRIDEGGRECSRCGVYKAWEHFTSNSYGTSGHQSWCRECFREHCGYTKQKEYVITAEGREYSICGQFKPWDQFHRRNDLSTGRMSACRSCIRIKSRRDKDQGRTRDADLRRKYDITLKEYRQLLQAQGAQCVICGARFSGIRGNGTELWLSVDHDHETGTIRGLLCQKCNVMLGMANDDIGLLQRAITYLGATPS